MDIGSWKSVENARAVLDQLLFAALLVLLFFSHMLTLARWTCEAHDEFMRWWEGFKARRDRRSRESSPGS